MENQGFGYKIFAFLTGLSGVSAYGVILGVLFVCGLGVPIPEDITLVAAGFLAGQGKISLFGAFVVGFIGVLVGDTLLFSIGRKFGRRVFTWPYFRRVFTEERVKKAESKIQARSKTICFMARFMPGLRAPIYLTAGVLRVPFKNFFLLDGLAALLSVPIWIVLGWYFHSDIGQLFQTLASTQKALIVCIAIVLLFFVTRWALKKRKQK